MSKRLCTVCEKTPLHHDNKSGICRSCKKTHSEAPVSKSAAKVKTPAARGAVLERTAKQPERPFKGLNLLVIEAVENLGAKATVANIAGYMQKQSAFKEHEQDPARAARWHSWHLKKNGYLRAASAA